jgi:hypothetical protein
MTSPLRAYRVSGVPMPTSLDPPARARKNQPTRPRTLADAAKGIDHVSRQHTGGAKGTRTPDPLLAKRPIRVFDRADLVSLLSVSSRDIPLVTGVMAR